MKKNKIKIFFVMFILISVFFLLIIYTKNLMDEDKEKSKKDEKICNIDIDAEDNISVIESCKIDLKEPSKKYNKYAIYSVDLLFDRINIVNEIKVYVDGEEIVDYYKIQEGKYNNNRYNYDKQVEDGRKYFSKHMTDVTIYNLEYGKHVINVEYEINPQIIQQYYNLSVLRLTKNENFLDYKIKINFSKEVELFKVNTRHAVINKINEKEYLIDMSNTSKILDKSYIELMLDKYIVDMPNKISQEYNIITINKIVTGENFAFKYPRNMILITIVLFILVKLLTRRRIIYKNYIKSTKILLEPIYAESLIDGKIGTKELIMSCIMDLVYRKNIEILNDNETLKINNLYNTNEIEKKIVYLIFNRQRTISFKELDIKFNLNAKFGEELEKIKDDITKNFLNEGIYSKIGEIVLKIIKTIALINVLNFIPLTLSINKSMSIESIMVIRYIISLFGIALANLKIKTKTNYKMSNYDGDSETFDSLIGGIILVIAVIYTYITILIEAFESNILILIIDILIAIVNIKIFKKSKIHCLTSKGIMEYNKVYALKRYIKDYSLMEQREIDGIKIWDRYLAYACAFGIAIKINEKIDEDAIKMNMLFQKFDYFS